MYNVVNRSKRLQIYIKSSHKVCNKKFKCLKDNCNSVHTLGLTMMNSHQNYWKLSHFASSQILKNLCHSSATKSKQQWLKN